MRDELRPIERALLKAAASDVLPRLLRTWRSCELYEGLAKRGLVVEVECANPFIRSFRITDAGTTHITSEDKS